MCLIPEIAWHSGADGTSLNNVPGDDCNPQCDIPLRRRRERSVCFCLGLLVPGDEASCPWIARG